MRRFCNVPGDMLSNFLTSLLLSHFLDWPCPGCMSCLISVSNSLLNSLRSSLVIISRFICPSCLINFKPVQRRHQLKSPERYEGKCQYRKAGLYDQWRRLVTIGEETLLIVFANYFEKLIFFSNLYEFSWLVTLLCRKVVACCINGDIFFAMHEVFGDHFIPGTLCL